MKTHSPQPLPAANGYILLISVVVTGAIASSIAVALLTFGAAAVQSTLVTGQMVEARTIADACVEEAIQQLNLHLEYGGGTTLTFDRGECSVVTVTGTGAVDREIHVEATVSRITQRMKVMIGSVGYPSIVTSWQRVAEF